MKTAIKKVSILVLLLAIVPTLTFGVTDEAKDKVVAPFTFTPFSNAAQLRLSVEALVVEKKDVNTAMHFMRALTKGTTQLPSFSTTATGENANATFWSAQKQKNIHPNLAGTRNLDMSAYKFVPKQTSAQVDQNVKINNLDKTAGGGFSASYQDIPDWGYVRISDGIINMESYNEFPDTSGFNSFWCQSPDRSSGIRILQPVDSPRPQDRLESYLVFLDGFMYTTQGGERVILLSMLYPITYNFPIARPMYLPIKSLVTPLAPNGLQVKISGKVVKRIVLPPLDINGGQPASYFYMDDGSGLETDNPTVRGIKVVDPYYGYNWPWPNVGDTIIITGSPAGKVHPIFYRSTDGLNILDWTGTNYYTISGTVTADADASGQTVWVGCEGGSTTAMFDTAGVATYEFRCLEGYYNVFARTPGYGGVPEPGHALKCVDVCNDYTGVNFVLEPMNVKRTIDVSVARQNIDHDGLSTTDGFVLLRDYAGARYANQPITLTVTAGQIVSCDPVTDYQGKARFVLRSTNKAQTAVITATNGEFAGRTFIYYHEVDEPVVIITSPHDGDTVSGVTGHEIEVWDTNVDGSDDICKNTLLVDGKECGTFCPAVYDEEDELVKRPGFNTAEFPNGEHVLSAMVTDKAGHTMISNEVHLTFSNPFSELKRNQNDLYYARTGAEDFSFDFVANQVPWTFRIFTIADDDSETTVWSASGDQTGPVHLVWDGKVDGVLKSDIYMVSLDLSSFQPMTMAQKIAAAQAKTQVQVSKPANATTTVTTKTVSTADFTSQSSNLYWTISTSRGNGNILVASVSSMFDCIDNGLTYKEMRIVGGNAKKRNIDPIYVTDMHWKSEVDADGRLTYKQLGMDYWLGSKRAGNGCSIRHFYLNAHGAQVLERANPPRYQIMVDFADNMVYGTDVWDPKPETTEAFSDLNITPNMLKVIDFSVCYSMGSAAHPDHSIPWALGCRDDGAGSTFIGWVDKYKPFLNGENWVRGFWHYLCEYGGVSVYRANESLNNSPNPLYWNTMYHRLRMYTELESMTTWLE